MRSIPPPLSDAYYQKKSSHLFPTGFQNFPSGASSFPPLVPGQDPPQFWPWWPDSFSAPGIVLRDSLSRILGGDSTRTLVPPPVSQANPVTRQFHVHTFYPYAYLALEECFGNLRLFCIETQ